MNWLITGGCGFLGTNLIHSLMAEGGHTARVVDNLAVGTREDLARAADFSEVGPQTLGQPNADVELVVGDIKDAELAQRAAAGMDVIAHFAANTGAGPSVADPRTDCEANGLGTFDYLEAARANGVGRFVFTSTGGALIGNATPPVNEDSTPKPISPYGASKLCGEAYCNAYAGSYGLRTVMLRFANVYGPISAHKKGAVTAFAKALLQGEPASIFGTGNASRDFLHVDDLVKGIRLALGGDLAPGTTLHLASGRETPVQELWEIMKEAANKPDHPVEYLPARPGEVERNFAAYDRAREQLGFQPEISLEDGLRRTWEWFAANRQDALATTATDS